MLPTRIYLTGFMGSGKSTIGPELARALGYDFLDLDHLIEERAGKPIPLIFAEEGEPAFRTLEADLLREVSRREGVVVALGGGALTFEENLRVALGSGVVVYLRVPVGQLIRRLRGRTGRPLIMGSEGSALSDEDLRRRVELMIGAREPFYVQAHIIVDVGAQSPAETMEAVMQEIRALATPVPKADEAKRV